MSFLPRFVDQRYDLWCPILGKIERQALGSNGDRREVILTELKDTVRDPKVERQEILSRFNILAESYGLDPFTDKDLF